MPTKKLTAAFVARAAVTSGQDRTIYWDEGLHGFGLRVTKQGHRAYVVQYRDGRGRAGTDRRMTLSGVLKLHDARREAKKLLGQVAAGSDPLAKRRDAEEARRDTLKAIVEDYFRREGDKLRSADYRRSAFERLVFPRLAGRPIAKIKRSDIVRLLDGIEDEQGPAMAELVLRYLSKVFNWFAGRADEFRSPIVRGMGRIRDNARDRILSDDELRAFWSATASLAEAAHSPAYGCWARFMLLTATRRREAANMTRSELLNGDWIVPAARMKGGVEHVVPLSPAAQAILAAMPEIGDFVFTTTGRNALNQFARPKRTIDRLMLAELRKMSVERGDDPEKTTLAPWVFHDLRRSGRSLMSRAGIDADIAERCLAHKIGGVRGVYDRHAYHQEKKRAFEALAALIEHIVSPPAGNVIELPVDRRIAAG
jgi:integrase